MPSEMLVVIDGGCVVVVRSKKKWDHVTILDLDDLSEDMSRQQAWELAEQVQQGFKHRVSESWMGSDDFVQEGEEP